MRHGQNRLALRPGRGPEHLVSRCEGRTVYRPGAGGLQTDWQAGAGVLTSPALTTRRDSHGVRPVPRGEAAPEARPCAWAGPVAALGVRARRAHRDPRARDRAPQGGARPQGSVAHRRERLLQVLTVLGSAGFLNEDAYRIVPDPRGLSRFGAGFSKPAPG